MKRTYSYLYCFPNNFKSSCFERMQHFIKSLVLLSITEFLCLEYRENTSFSPIEKTGFQTGIYETNSVFRRWGEHNTPTSSSWFSYTRIFMSLTLKEHNLITVFWKFCNVR
jgi:hypothetical protein